jgi:hypothetical protein
VFSSLFIAFCYSFIIHPSSVFTFNFYFSPSSIPCYFYVFLSLCSIPLSSFELIPLYVFNAVSYFRHFLITSIFALIFIYVFLYFIIYLFTFFFFFLLRALRATLHMYNVTWK